MSPWPGHSTIEEASPSWSVCRCISAPPSSPEGSGTWAHPPGGSQRGRLIGRLPGTAPPQSMSQSGQAGHSNRKVHLKV